MEAVGERQTAGTSDGQTNRLVAAPAFLKHASDVGQQSGHGGTNVGMMAAVVGE